MDIHRISHEVARNPETYREEYRSEMRSYESLTRLPQQPEKIIRQTLAFLLSHPRMEEGLAETLVSSLSTTKCLKIRQLVLNGLFSLKRTGAISSSLLLKTLLEHSVELKSFLKRCREIADEAVIPIVQEYYRRGTDKQRCFCYYMIVYLFSCGHTQLEEDVCKGLVSEGKINRICHLYLLDQIDFEEEGRMDPMSLLSEEASKYGKRLLKHITEDKMEREEKILKMKTYVLFKRKFKLKGSVVPLAMGMIDMEKPDVKDLIGIIIGSATERNVMKIVGLIAENFCSEFRDDDYIVYGLNMMRELYCKFDPTVVGTVLVEDEDSEEHGTGDTEGYRAADACLLEDKMQFLEQLKDRILNCIECFRRNKVKGISFAYASVKNAVSHKRRCSKDVDYIKKKSTREEKIAMSKNSEARRKRGRKWVYEAPERKVVPRFVRGAHSRRRRIREQTNGGEQRT
jgi:hypothetical protein